MRLSRFIFTVMACTFVLMMMGGIVHTTGSSLACPDWPLCYGSAMPKMEGKVAVEHSHRLVATTVGILTIIQLLLLIRFRQRYPRLVRLGAAALGLVVFQGVLGGLTVIFKLPPEVSTAHLATSMLFLATLCILGLRARAFETGAGSAPALSPGLRGLLIGTAALAYLQMLLGALTRHTGGALACVNLPLCKGQLFPDGAYWIVQLHMTHRLGAVCLTIAAVALAIAFARAPIPRLWKGLAIALPILVLGQITLGVFSILTFLDLPVVTGHLAVAALIWITLISLLTLSGARRGQAMSRSAAHAPLGNAVRA